MSKQIQAVIFDIGGVLVRTRDQSGRRKWETRLGLSPGGAESLVLNSEMGFRAQRGEITTAELWDWVRDHLQLDEELDAFREDFWGGDTVDEALVALIEELRPNYRMAALSNAADSLLESLASYNLLDKFDLVVGSAFEGVMKPDPAIYLTTLRRLGVEAAEAVFIDDAPANVAAAAALGIQAIRFTPETDLRAELSRLGLVV